MTQSGSLLHLHTTEPLSSSWVTTLENLSSPPPLLAPLLRQDLAGETGIPPNSILPIKNYHCEMEPTIGPGILVLRALSIALNAATDFLRTKEEVGTEPEADAPPFVKTKVAPRRLPLCLALWGFHVASMGSAPFPCTGPCMLPATVCGGGPEWLGTAGLC